MIWVGASVVLRFVIAQSVGGTSIYGPLAASIIVLIWLYFLALAVLIGAAFNAAIREPAPPAGRPAPDRAAPAANRQRAAAGHAAARAERRAARQPRRLTPGRLRENQVTGVRRGGTLLVAGQQGRHDRRR
ncbi:hypothetical protein GCM10025868_04720 [Angustibacter aerolatus]|uniref:Uncharacterized protein n=1 Tax=Angustibacter aerolatus TaxID=1162965 RepID=A0ABQ6JBP8_9ACTN|nr:YhjD/YihY/BrkB family envelope integrity protein [Angustibacter aerolatus]GMA85222.1 hypothetical protein GCM10025868_04720 [Angustibacter aerolatus]